jgi:hypothetical protein
MGSLSPRALSAPVENLSFGLIASGCTYQRHSRQTPLTVPSSDLKAFARSSQPQISGIAIVGLQKFRMTRLTTSPCLIGTSAKPLVTRLRPFKSLISFVRDLPYTGVRDSPMNLVGVHLLAWDSRAKASVSPAVRGPGFFRRMATFATLRHGNARAYITRKPGKPLRSRRHFRGISGICPKVARCIYPAEVRIARKATFLRINKGRPKTGRPNIATSRAVSAFRFFLVWRETTPDLACVCDRPARTSSKIGLYPRVRIQHESREMRNGISGWEGPTTWLAIIFRFAQYTRRDGVYLRRSRNRVAAG